jgi:hypothetical protein
VVTVDSPGEEKFAESMLSLANDAVDLLSVCTVNRSAPVRIEVVVERDAGKTVICAALAGTPVTAGVTTCNPDFNLAQIGGIIRWTPVKNLTFSADVTSPCLTRSLLD